MHTYILTYIIPYIHTYIHTYIQAEKLSDEVLKIRNTQKKKDQLLDKIREIRIRDARAILLVEILSFAYNKYTNSKIAGKVYTYTYIQA